MAVIIEDDADIRHLLESVFEQAGFETVAAATGLDGIEAVRAHDPVVTTLDVGLPGIDGFETAKRIRAVSDTYLVMLTARSDEIDTLQGLEAGADDYITKPFRPRELRARVEAMLRRPRSAAPVDAAAMAPTTSPSTLPPTPGSDVAALGWLEHRGLRLSSAERRVQQGDADLELTRSEFDLLGALLEARRRVLSKAELAAALHDESVTHFVTDADKRAVEVHMANLRKKLGDDPSDPRWIETVRGVGYRLTA
ncbi:MULTISPECIES: response regulator transcription factor [unclassified Leifsonia]|uniref:response regulator transcription factor n=1 Tax=unclassified Leifsonia TaxID=2663824 RepID=UPI000A52AAC0|nr:MULTISPECIES: response regulator transcription factor [unclassified Leifsonia]